MLRTGPAAENDHSLHSGSGGFVFAAPHSIERSTPPRRLHRALQSNVGDANLYYLMGDYWERAGRRDEAVAAYRRAIAIDPAHRGANDHLAALLQTP